MEVFTSPPTAPVFFSPMNIMALDRMYYYNMLCVCICVFLAQKIHISENAKEALEEIGSYHIVFRGSMEVKVN